MIRLRLTSRAQTALSRGVLTLVDLVAKAKKANQAAFLSTAEQDAEIAFLSGDGKTSEGLLGLLRGEQATLDFGGEYDEKLATLDALEEGFSLDELHTVRQMLLRAQEMGAKLDLAVPDILVLVHDRLPEIATAEFNRREIDRQLQLADAEATRERTPQEIADEAEAKAADALAERRKRKLPATLDEALAEDVKDAIPAELPPAPAPEPAYGDGFPTEDPQDDDEDDDFLGGLEK